MGKTLWVVGSKLLFMQNGDNKCAIELQFESFKKTFVQELSDPWELSREMTNSVKAHLVTKDFL